MSQSGGVSVGAAVGAADGAIVALFVTLSDDASAAANADAASVSRVLRRQRDRRRIVADKLFDLPVVVTRNSRFSLRSLDGKKKGNG